MFLLRVLPWSYKSAGAQALSRFGSLSHLIRGAAVDAILDGTEKITRQTLDRVGLDQAAETMRTRRKNARNRHDPSA